MRKTTVLSIVVCLSLLSFNTAKAAAGTLEPLLQAMWTVESSHKLAPPLGDGGLARGIMQIHRDHWHDAVFNSAGKRIHPGTYADCDDPLYAAKVTIWYWERYCPDALQRRDFKSLALCHHWGPAWRRHRNDDDHYWAKIHKALQKQK